VVLVARPIVVWFALKISLFADCQGGEAVNLIVAFRPRLSVTSTVAVPAWATVRRFVTEAPATGDAEPKVPNVLANVTEVAPGADTTTCFATFVTIVKSPLGTVVTVKAPTAALTVNDKELAFPRAVVLMAAGEVLAVSPETTVVATPDALVVPLAPDTPRTAASVDVKVTGTPAKSAPLAFLTKAVKVTVLPPAVNVVPAELDTVSVAPLI
jgi:hypothetical protein